MKPEYTTKTSTDALKELKDRDGIEYDKVILECQKAIIPILDKQQLPFSVSMGVVSSIAAMILSSYIPDKDIVEVRDVMEQIKTTVIYGLSQNGWE